MIQAHDFGQGHIGMKEDHANQAVLAECVAKGAPLTRKAMTVQGLAVRLSYALLRFSVKGSRAALIAASRSGFKVTTVIGDQLRVGPDQRRGRRAWGYSPPGAACGDPR